MFAAILRAFGGSMAVLFVKVASRESVIEVKYSFHIRSERMLVAIIANYLFLIRNRQCHDVFRRVVVHRISPAHTTDKTLGPIKISIFSVTIDAKVEREFPTCLGTGTSQRFVLGGACL